ncbi:MAG: hypothetical protein WC042_02220 [Candidatus Paceibacterota bacterium]|jgi:hypothetical protein|nr:hypothetical protein [Candidatus Paceibacterota bacterium]MDD3548472.1 hypothetical protein [Candidatus Paceibacterota bacterium]MDD4999218.1 hypothetical protein [Candidatus Paceibacterota bacterium]MDD5545352.1 hypothetical protein [Candidatus Paceibacterota bacterium]
MKKTEKIWKKVLTLSNGRGVYRSLETDEFVVEHDYCYLAEPTKEEDKEIREKLMEFQKDKKQ